MIAGASSERGVLICTRPRLLGRRLHTDGVIALNLCSGSPNCVQRQRLHVPFDVGAGLMFVTAGESAELRGRHRQRAGAHREVFEPHQRLTDKAAGSLVQRDRVFHLVDGAHLEMILQVLTHARQIVLYVDAMLLAADRPDRYRKAAESVEIQ